MARTPIDVRKSAPARSPTPDPWQSLRTEMDRLFDRFSGAFGVPSMRRMFDFATPWPEAGGFGLAAPAVDITEDEKQ